MASAKTAQTERRKFRRKLESWGMSPHLITICMDEFRTRQKDKAAGLLPKDAGLCNHPEYLRLRKLHKGIEIRPKPAEPSYDEYYESLKSDKGYSPPRIDPVLKGPARATGATAKAVKRQKTMTKFEYDNQEE